MAPAFVLSVAICAASVPPGAEVVNHAHPGHYAQPTIRIFERKAVDLQRRLAWEDYCRHLDALWAEYRAAGSTPIAWRTYQAAAGEARRRYVFGDPYLAPIVNPYHP